MTMFRLGAWCEEQTHQKWVRDCASLFRRVCLTVDWTLVNGRGESLLYFACMAGRPIGQFALETAPQLLRAQNHFGQVSVVVAVFFFSARLIVSPDPIDAIAGRLPNFHAERISLRRPVADALVGLALHAQLLFWRLWVRS